MGCKKPLLRIEDITKWQRSEIDGHWYHPARIESTNILEEISKLKGQANHYNYNLIPCGKCIECRLDYSKQWANRGYLEAKDHNENYFITLTYDEMKVPINDWWNEKYIRTAYKTLRKEHLAAFIKAMRQDIHRQYSKERKTNHLIGDEPRFKFMGCGEYGAETERPHYHLILFGVHFPPETFYKARIINNETYWQNKWIEKNWKYGISNISIASWNTIAYTARYITKKIKGKGSKEHYKQAGIEPEFLSVSKGIGENYYNKNWEKIYERDEIIIKNKRGSVSQKPPKYFDNKFKKEHPGEYKKIQRKREWDAERQQQVKDKNTSLTRWEQFQIDLEAREEKAVKLKRAFEAKSKSG